MGWRIVALLLLLAPALRAHDPYESWTNLIVRADVLEVRITMAQVSALRLIDPTFKAARAITPENFASLRPRLAREAAALYALGAAAEKPPLAPHTAEVALTEENDVVFTLRYARPPAGALRIHAAFLKKLGEGYGGILEASDTSGHHLGWEQLSFAQPDFQINVPAPPAPQKTESAMSPRLLAPLAFATAALATPATPPSAAEMQRAGTRPGEHNDTTLRALTPEEIYPNLNFYAVNPLYQPGRPLGWARDRIEEKIDRGVVALATTDKKIYIGWRLLKSDPADIAFDVYRRTDDAPPVKLNATPLARTCDFVDATAPLDRAHTWIVRAVLPSGTGDSPVMFPEGSTSLPPAGAVAPAAENDAAVAPPAAYRAIKLKADIVQGISMVGIGDLDGDGVYDFVVKHPGGGKDPGRITVSPGTYKIDAYNGKTGAFLWRVDLGWNVDMGVWWTPFVVRDLDGDNKAEVCLRTKPYAATLDAALPGARAGNALEGPEWLTILDGETGQAIDQADWIELGRVQDWGDNTGNRASRHLMGVAYLDGRTPAVLVLRGTYGLMRCDAWVLENKKLKKLWRWTNERAPFLFHGQGAHGIQVGDIDGDGCDEILNGAIAIDHDGRSMWSTGLGHGDRLYLTDIDPSRPGLEVAYICEDAQPQLGVNLRDARTGDLLWGAREPHLDNAIDQVAVGDIDPRHPGMEVWINKGLKQLFYSAKGEPIAGPVPGTSELVWWDADLRREQIAPGGFARSSAGVPPAPTPRAAETPAPLNHNNATVSGSARGGLPPFRPRSVGKWNAGSGTLQPIASGIQGSVHQVADITGDWREEIVTFTQGELRIYSTTIPAADRRVCLMQDPIYRHSVCFRTMGYTHVPQVSYYLGEK